MSLADLQRTFLAGILSADMPPTTGLRGRASAGMAVYRNAYRAQLVETLRDTFEATHAWLGDARFDAAARRYVESCPARSWTLADYGGGFAAALRRDAPEDGEVAELAWLDWSLRAAFHGPDAPSLAPEALAGIDWTNCRLRLAPTLRLGELAWNSAAIWSAIAEDRVPPPAERLAAATAVRVWRCGLSPRFATISFAERGALAAAQAGRGFADICGGLAAGAAEDEAAAMAGGFLAAWVRDGLIAGIVPGGG